MKVQLNKLPGMSRFSPGYFYDSARDEVISTLVNSAGIKLFGSYSSGRHLYNLQLARVAGLQPSAVVRASALREAYAEAEKGKVKVAEAEKGKVKVAEAAQKNEKGWIIGTITNGQFSIATSPRVHSNIAAARVEAERLAKEFPNKVFVTLKIEGMVRATGVQWF